MTQARVYLDHNATTPLRPAAREAMARAFDAFGNPSSVHAEGRRSRAVLDEARRQVAGLLGVAADTIVFTSGGTEALNIALAPHGPGAGAPFDRLLIGAGEHPAVRVGHRFGAAVETIALDRDGRLDLAALKAALARPDCGRVMLALQAANNETGVVQPVAEAAALVHARGGAVVCDAVQAAGKADCDMAALGADILAISAHKFGGPKGVGALCVAPSHTHVTRAVVRGGGQERGLRAGTENVIGIAGMGAAAEAALAQRFEEAGRLARWRDRIEACVKAVSPDALVFGAAAPRLANTSCFATPGLDAQVLTMSLDLAGIAVSSGSACAAGKVAPSHVLTAMGIAPEVATSTLRVSLGWTTGEADIEAFARAYARALETMRPRRAA